MVGFLQGLGQFGVGAAKGYMTMDDWMAERRDAELKANAAKIYGQAMQKMAQPATPWRVPMSNDYTPPPPPMNMQNFMRALPQGADPQAVGMAVNQFSPIEQQSRLGDYRDQQIKNDQARVQQGAQRNELGQLRINLRERQMGTANAFRERALQLQAIGANNPTAQRAFEKVKSQYNAVNTRVDRLRNQITEYDTKRLSGGSPEEYAVQRAQVQQAYDAANAELDAVEQELQGFDVSGQGLPQPTAPPAKPPTKPPVPQPAAPAIPPQAIELLRANPNLAPAFEQKYGPGSAEQILQPQGGPYIGASPAQKAAVIQQQNTLASQDMQNRQQGQFLDDQQELLNRNPQLQMPTGLAGQPQAPQTPHFKGATVPSAQVAAPMTGQEASLDVGPDAPTLNASDLGPSADQQAESIRQELAASGFRTDPADTLADLRVKKAVLGLRGAYGAAAKETGAMAKAVGQKLEARKQTLGPSPNEKLDPGLLKRMDSQYKAREAAKVAPNPYDGLAPEQLRGEMERLFRMRAAAKSAEQITDINRKLDLIGASKPPRKSASVGGR